MRGAALLVMAMLLVALAAPAWATGIAGADNPPPAKPAAADPLWNPSVDQVQEWVYAGMEAAAAGMYLVDVPGVQAWAWAGDTPCGDGRRLEWAALLTPQFVGTVTGWEAAWHQDLWARIQAGEGSAVAGELAAAVVKDWQAGTVPVLLGLTDYNGSSSPQVWGWLRMWHSKLSESVISRARGDERQGSPTVHWAALYYLSQAGMGNATGDEVKIIAQPAFWDPNREPAWPDDDLARAIGTPDVAPDTLRVYVGTPAEWAFVEWAVGGDRSR